MGSESGLAKGIGLGRGLGIRFVGMGGNFAAFGIGEEVIFGGVVGPDEGGAGFTG